jgi:hypothetical protein
MPLFARLADAELANWVHRPDMETGVRRLRQAAGLMTKFGMCLQITDHLPAREDSH